jgi:hypothetical protein
MAHSLFSKGTLSLPTTKIITQESWSLNEDLKKEFHEYKAGIQIT